MPNEQHRTLIDRTLRNKQFMKSAPLCIGPAMNFILAVFNVVVWWSQSSLWAGTLAVYFAILCFMGSYVAVCTISPKESSERKVLVVCGVSIIALTVSIAFIKYRVIGDLCNEVLHPYATIALAAFTFATAANAIIDATKARHGDYYQQAFLRISMASMLGAFMMLEQQMLGTFGELTDTSTATTIEAVSGLVVALLLLAMGVSLLVKARKL